MSKKGSSTIRFAFGTEKNPASAVWRVNVLKRKGDIFINCAPEFGNELHISLHASGQFDLKLGGNNRYPLEPPWKDPTGIICGPAIFFYNWDRGTPPPKPTGKTQQIYWLGLPKKGHIFIIRTYYCGLHSSIRPEANEILIGGPEKALLFNSRKNFYLIAEHREMLEEELKDLKTQKVEEIVFEDKTPDQMELIRISKTPQGPSAIIMERFEVKSKKN